MEISKHVFNRVYTLGYPSTKRVCFGQTGGGTRVYTLQNTRHGTILVVKKRHKNADRVTDLNFIICLRASLPPAIACVNSLEKTSEGKRDEPNDDYGATTTRGTPGLLGLV